MAFNPAPKTKAPHRPTRGFRFDQSNSDLIDATADAYNTTTTRIMNTLVETYLPKLLAEKKDRRRTQGE